MPNFQQAMNEEIRRLARKEMKSGMEELKKQIANLRKIVLEQNKRLKELEKLREAGCEKKAADAASPVPEKKKAVRITPERIRKMRQKITAVR